MIDKFLSKTGVGIALALMVAELSYVNTLSLEYMFNTHDLSATIFGIIGAIAFSSVTVLIMRLGRQSWAKIVFPLFDMLLTFCGLNLEHPDDFTANPFRFAMSIILSVFSGLNTYSLGIINADQHSGEELAKQLLESKNKELESNLCETKGELLAVKGNYEKLTSDYKRVCEIEKIAKSNYAEYETIINEKESDFGNVVSECNTLQCYLDEARENEKILQSKLDELGSNNSKMATYNIDLKSKLDEATQYAAELESKLSQSAAELAKYKPAALAAELARIRKKRPENRSSEEIKLLEEAA